MPIKYFAYVIYIYINIYIYICVCVCVCVCVFVCMYVSNILKSNTWHLWTFTFFSDYHIILFTHSSISTWIDANALSKSEINSVCCGKGVSSSLNILIVSFSCCQCSSNAVKFFPCIQYNSVSYYIFHKYTMLERRPILGWLRSGIRSFSSYSSVDGLWWISANFFTKSSFPLFAFIYIIAIICKFYKYQYIFQLALFISTTNDSEAPFASWNLSQASWKACPTVRVILWAWNDRVNMNT